MRKQHQIDGLHSADYNNPALCLCSLAAQGLWWGLLCKMAQCPILGVLQTDDTPWTDEDIARAKSVPPKLARKLMKELVDRKVASRNQAGAYICTRMWQSNCSPRRVDDADKPPGEMVSSSLTLLSSSLVFVCPFFKVSEEQDLLLGEAFPSIVERMSEYKKAASWIQANGPRKNYKRFLHNWFERASRFTQGAVNGQQFESAGERKQRGIERASENAIRRVRESAERRRTSGVSA